MKQQIFEQTYDPLWQEIESLIDDKTAAPSRDFPQQYKLLCQHLAVAKSRRYTSYLITRLNNLVVASHHLLYKKSAHSNQQWLWFLVAAFPNAIRKNWKLVAVASCLFYLPLLVVAYGCYNNEELIYSILPHENVREFESMYNPSNEVLGEQRSASSKLSMFGYYIKNNIGIGFRSFAGGILLGLGSIFFLIYNGFVIGGVAGHLTQLGFVDTFYGFVSGHSAFELTAIVFCGAAGLKLGLAILDPGDLKRTDAIRLAGREAIIIVYGSALMLVIAAFIEAFWSSSQTLTLPIKLTFGAFWALALCLYFAFSGRRLEL